MYPKADPLGTAWDLSLPQTPSKVKECLQEPQNQVAAAKLRNLQWAFTHCQSIFGQVVIAISRGIK
jgi:hypothetical protein